MNTKFAITTASILAALAATPAFSQSTTAASAAPSGAMSMSADMTSGEVRKVDKESKKITLKHAEIKNLDMPGMTMVFQVKDPAMLDMVKQGDKVMFRAERMNGALTVTSIEPMK